MAKFITVDNQVIEYVGKVASIGQGGSGKTYMINSMVNYLAEKEVYSWDEEKNMAGTIGVTPYSLAFPGKKRIIVNDNPGQDSFEAIRQMIASMGEVYNGYILVCDSIGFNFRNIAIAQIKSMLDANTNQTFVPIVIIISKKDLRDTLLQTNIIKDLSKIIAESIKNIHHGLEIKFRDRAFNKNGLYTVKLKDQALIPFTIAEQVLTNAIDDWLKKDPINGFTSMNVRLLVRALLLGYCEAMKKTIDLSKYPAFSSMGDPHLVNRLNYHRPTAFETGSGWEKLGGSAIQEPPILKHSFDPKTVELIFKNYVFASEEKIDSFLKELRKLGQIYKWKIVGKAFTNSIDLKGKEEIKQVLAKLIDHIYELKQKKTSSKIKDFSSLGLDEF